MLIVCTILYNGLVILQHSCSVVEDSRIFARADAVGCSAPEAGVSNRSKSDSPTNTRPKREGEAGSPERTEKSRMKSADSLLKVSCETHGRACCFTLAASATLATYSHLRHVAPHRLSRSQQTPSRNHESSSMTDRMRLNSEC